MLYAGFYNGLCKAFRYLTVIIILASCDSDKPGVPEEMVPLPAVPQIVALNTREGYIIDPVTGDSIQPIINLLGDTIKTGVPVPARGRVINPSSVARPKVVPAGKPKVVPVPKRVHKIPENLTIIPVDMNSLKTFTPGVDTSSFVLVNSFGDTVPTGVPIPAEGKIVPFRQPEPVMAFPPFLKDNASMNMKYLDVEQGMSSTKVTSILEDSRGNLWFGTHGGGVNMYNGETFTHFTREEMGINSSYINCIYEDSHGNIWFGTQGGVSMFNGITFRNFTENEGLGKNNITSILEDSHGNIWLGTWGGGVSMYDGETFTLFTPKEGLSHNIVESILEDSHGNLWFGTRGGGVSIYNGNTFTHLTQEQGLINDQAGGGYRRMTAVISGSEQGKD